MSGNNNGDGQQHQLGPPPGFLRRWGGIQQRHQAAKLQRLAYDAALALERDLRKSGRLTVTRDDAQALVQLVRAWDTAADRLRVLRGRGLPASVRSKTTQAAPLKPLEPA